VIFDKCILGSWQVLTDNSLISVLSRQFNNVVQNNTVTGDSITIEIASGGIWYSGIAIRAVAGGIPGLPPWTGWTA